MSNHSDEAPKLTSRQRKLKELQRQQQKQTVPSTPLRACELYFKNRVDVPDFSQALSAEALQWSAPPSHGFGSNDESFMHWKDEQLRRRKARYSDRFKILPGCERCESFDVVLVDSLPGLVYLPNLLPPAAQRALAKSSLLEGPRTPNTTSLDPHFKLPFEGLWQTFRADASTSILKKSAVAGQPGQRRAPCNQRPIDASNFTSERADERSADLARDQASQGDEWQETLPAAEVMSKLRWASIGMAYHWGTKTYLEDVAPPIPTLIHQLCEEVVRSIDWSAVFSAHESAPPDAQHWADTYQPQGGIINYYSEKDTLTSHVDHSEADTERPLVSVSLGLDSVFVAGGRSREERPPLPFLLHSGDVILMSGPSRRIYHGVPRILKTGHIDAEEDQEWVDGGFEEYMSSHRLNLNVRQVYPAYQTTH